MTKQSSAVFTALATLGLLLAGGDRGAAAANPGVASAAPAEFSAQAQPRPRRVPRIEVFPRRYYYDPGPDAVRQCRAWYVQELRPSGPVVVPRMRCWWERGY
jgi:hypothetical protein